MPITRRGLYATLWEGSRTEQAISTTYRSPKMRLKPVGSMVRNSFLTLGAEKTCQPIASKLGDPNRSLSRLPRLSLARVGSGIHTVTPLHQSATKWLSPPDPSVNYYTARDTHHQGTTTWFIESMTFKDWKQSGSLFWIHGKRTLLRLVRLGCK